MTRPLDLLAFRRAVSDLYRAVRSATDPRAGWEEWRAGRDALLASSPVSPLPPAAREGFSGLPFGDYDPTWREELEVDPHVEPERLEVPTGTDGVVPFERVGVLRTRGGPLDLWALRSYGGGLFLPVRDAGSGPLSYGGGRYLLDTVKGADLGGDVDPATGRGTLVVDLDFAYAPSCAYDPTWACPLPPPGNRLDAEVGVGELRWHQGSG